MISIIHKEIVKVYHWNNFWHDEPNNINYIIVYEGWYKYIPKYQNKKRS